MRPTGPAARNPSKSGRRREPPRVDVVGTDAAIASTWMGARVHSGARVKPTTSLLDNLDRINKLIDDPLLCADSEEADRSAWNELLGPPVPGGIDGETWSEHPHDIQLELATKTPMCDSTRSTESLSSCAAPIACMHARIYGFTHVCMHTCMHAPMYACVDARIYACTHVWMHRCVHTCMHAHMYACTHAHVHAEIYECAYLCGMRA